MRITPALLILMVVALPARAAADTLIWFNDLATNPSFNQGIALDLTLRADGSVRAQLANGAYAISGTARSDLHTFGNNSLGFNLAPGVTATVDPNRFIPAPIAEFDAEVGPYGVFDFVLDGFSRLNTLRLTQAGGFSSVLEPFAPNEAGLIAAVHVRSSQTGQTAFLGADAELNPTLVPEPGSMLLLGTGLVAVARAARKRMRSEPDQG